MTSARRPSRLRTHAPLAGWRARVWAWALFLALFKGLVPPVAIAAVAMHGDPAALLCGSGAVAAGKAAAAGTTGFDHECVCAPAGDGALPGPAVALPPRGAEVASVVGARASPAATSSRRQPPARGPPAAA